MLTLAALALPLALAPAEAPPIAKLPPGFAIVPGTLRVADDGTRIACVLKKGDKQFPFTGEKPGPGWTKAWPPQLHPSGRHVAFRVMKSSATGFTMSVVHNGRVIVTDEWVGPVALDPVNGTPAYLVSGGWITENDGSRSHASMTMHFGKVKGKKWSVAAESMAPSFFADGTSLLCVGDKGGVFGVIRLDSKGREERLELDASWPFEAIVRPDGSEVAYTYLTNPHQSKRDDWVLQFAVRREPIGKRASKERSPDESAGYATAGAPVYSADGRHLALRFRDGDSFGVVLDGARDVKAQFAFVDDVSISPQGDQVAYRAARGCKVLGPAAESVLHGTVAEGGRWLVVHGSERSPEFDQVGAPVWSPDGSRCAFAVQDDEGWHVRCGRARSDRYVEVSPLAWSADGENVTFAALQGEELRWVRLAAD